MLFSPPVNVVSTALGVCGCVCVSIYQNYDKIYHAIVINLPLNISTKSRGDLGIKKWDPHVPLRDLVHSMATAFVFCRNQNKLCSIISPLMASVKRKTQ
jgi:hypothetical protein